MTLAQYRDALMSHLTEDLDTDRDEGGPHAQRAKMLLDHIGAIAAPEPVALDKQILDALQTISQGVRAAEVWASERTRQQ